MFSLLFLGEILFKTCVFYRLTNPVHVQSLCYLSTVLVSLWSSNLADELDFHFL